MDIENDTFKPFMKPNNTPLYVKLSNHPPNVTKNIPAAVYLGDCPPFRQMRQCSTVQHQLTKKH